MDDGDRTALSEEIVQRPPSSETWAALCELFALWPEGDAKHRAVEQAANAIAAWDDTLRSASSAHAYLFTRDKLSSVARLVKSIDIYRRTTNGSRELTAIAQSELAANLARLAIVRSEISSKAWNSLITSPFLENLTTLDVRHTVLTLSDIVGLFRSTRLRSLQYLSLVDVGLSEKAMLAITQPAVFDQLRRADFSVNVLGDNGLEVLLRLPWITQLKSLALGRNYLSRDGMRRVITLLANTELNDLDLSDNAQSPTDQDEIAMLARSAGIQLTI